MARATGPGLNLLHISGGQGPAQEGPRGNGHGVPARLRAALGGQEGQALESELVFGKLPNNKLWDGLGSGAVGHSTRAYFCS